jgi:maleate isomerase
MKTIKLGMLTPSSNTVVEPVTSAIVSALPGVSAHFSRLPVTEISLKPHALDQFTMEPFLNAAQLLADARMDAIAWNGTSAAWKGFDQDDQLCAAISERFNVPATASMIALNEILTATGVKRFGLVTPYLDDVQHKIIENYTSAGYEIIAERHSGISVNYDFCEIDADHIASMTRAVAAENPPAIMLVCTNLRAAPLVDQLEQETAIPIYDSLSAVVWRALRLAGVDARPIEGWGRLFASAIL